LECDYRGVGVIKENKRELKDICCWNDDLLKTISEKNEYYKCLHHHRSDNICGAKGRAYAELYRKLDTKEEENDVYKMAKLRKRKTRDFNQVKCI
jgi:hypothetical protein